MAERIRPSLYTLPYGVDICDATVNAIFDRVGSDALSLSNVTMFLPNNRAIKAMTEAFVRRTKPGLLLPHMVAVGDLALDEALGPILDPLDGETKILPVIAPMQRLLLLARLLVENGQATSKPLNANEALRLARYLGEVVDELEIEQISLREFDKTDNQPDLAAHWQSAYGQLQRLLPLYYAELDKLGRIGSATRRNLLLDQLGCRLRYNPPANLIVAAGISTAAPAIARLLKQVAILPNAMVIFPSIDLSMEAADWELLGPRQKTEDVLKSLPSYESHPQFHLKLLLSRMGVSRDEVSIIGNLTGHVGHAITDIFCLPAATANWRELPNARKKLPHARLMVADDIAEEARSVAILLRGAVEKPGLRAALATPDRELAIRVAAQLRRWDIVVNDSAGTPLAQSPEGMLILALAEAIADRFSPVSILAIAKHPLVRKGEGRLDWLELVRKLDFALRGPNCGTRLSAITQAIAAWSKEARNAVAAQQSGLSAFWQVYSEILLPLENVMNDSFSYVLNALIEVATALTDGVIWQGATGRQLAQFFEELSAADLDAIGKPGIGAMPAIFSELFNGEVIRPKYGNHPRISIYGLLEARFQQPDLLICGGLNEGSWPQIPQPDPWLAPHIRRQLILPSLDRNIGLSAHDLATALGAKEVVLTRSKRDRSGPTVASRFLLRAQAYLAENMQEETDALILARKIDKPENQIKFDKPEPMPTAEQRRVGLSVTDFDKLKADPFSFYASKILRLKLLDPVGAEPGFAWRGTMIHDVLQDWAIEDKCDPAGLIARAEALLANPALHPSLRALWQPRISESLKWVAEETVRLEEEEGRKLIAAEVGGYIFLEKIRIKGRADRIDRLSDGGLAIIDYKSGQSPKDKQIYAGFALQLGLIGLIAQEGGMSNVSGNASLFEYWSLAKRPRGGGFGLIKRPTTQTGSDKKRSNHEFVAFARDQAIEALRNWITGNAPFTAKLHPEFPTYSDYDQLMRLQEWDGREPIDDSGRDEQ